MLIGHASQAVLPTSRNIVHAFIAAPLAQRARFVAAEEGISPEEASKLVKATDAERADFLQRYYGMRWDNPANYDLVLNTGRLPVSAAAGLIVDLVRARLEES